MPDIDDLEKRVSKLEAAQNENTKTLNWVVGTLGRVAADVSSVKEDVKALREEVAAVDRRLTGEVRSLREDMPGIVGDAVREAMKGREP